MKLMKLSDAIGIEATSIDLMHPIADSDFQRLYRGWLDSTILLVRGQNLTPEGLISFSRRFGELMVYTRSENAMRSYPEILILSNILREGRPIGAAVSGRYWHTDGHYLETPPAASFLYGAEVPPVGGDTWFANMYSAYDSLAEEMKRRLVGLKVVISRVQSRPYNYPDKPPVTEAERAAWPDMPQPMVRTHPESGRKALYVGGNVPWRIIGMPVEESEPLVTELQRHAIQSRFVHVHRWQPGDLIVWDNRSCLHRATEYDQIHHRRLMYRTTTVGDKPIG
ncbi:MAG TPA: TauD/TfdA family dioxygenase [Gemmataceae bacterium]|jgi:taurine dioxygenase/putative 2-oxoglutarate oxygenase|nr:TauD/TfdA family dioxygenase [Gemmataceae bacterium]